MARLHEDHSFVRWVKTHDVRGWGDEQLKFHLEMMNIDESSSLRLRGANMKIIYELIEWLNVIYIKREIQRRKSLTIWLRLTVCHGKIHHAIKNGKPSISMGHLYHGKLLVSHNQRLNKKNNIDGISHKIGSRDFCIQ